jgi:hypothetical protein
LLAVVGVFVLIVLRATVFDSSAKYGHVDIPGSAVLHLPGGRVDISYREFVPSAQNGLFVPRAGISVRPAGRPGAYLTLADASGSTVSVNGVAHRKVLTVEVPDAGDYSVRTSGAIGHDAPQFLFGTSTSIVPVLVRGAVALVALWLLSFAGIALARRRQTPGGDPTAVGVEGLPPSSGAATATVAVDARSEAALHQSVLGALQARGVTITEGAPQAADPLDKLKKLADLHTQGVLTDAEFETEKAKILREV